MLSRKLILLPILFLSSYSLAQADVPAPPAPATTTPPPVATTPAAPAAVANTNAVAFAVEAGSIAGATQACGQDVSVFVTRVNQALTKLAANPADKVQAIASFQKTLQQAQLAQTNNHPIPCSQVIQDYNSLPILRPDYETAVIAQLNPTMTPATPAPASTPGQQQTAPPATTTPAAPTVAPSTPPAPLAGPSPVASAPMPAGSAPTAVPPPPPAAVPAPAPTNINNNPYQNVPDQNNPPAGSY